MNAGQVAQQFGMALWLGYPTAFALNTLLDKAKQRFAKAKRPWANCRDPVAAFFLTISRLGWAIVDSTAWRVHRGASRPLEQIAPGMLEVLTTQASQRLRAFTLAEERGRDLGAGVARDLLRP